MAYSNSSDDCIIAEAVRTKFNHLPLVRIPLYGRIAPAEPDVAEVNFKDDPPTVRRWKQPVAGG